MTEKQKNAEQIAGEILHLSRNMLLVNLRFLDAALNQLELRPVTASSLLTDGKRLCYRPEWVLRTFQTAKEIPVRDYKTNRIDLIQNRRLQEKIFCKGLLTNVCSSAIM